MHNVNNPLGSSLASMLRQSVLRHRDLFAGHRQQPFVRELRLDRRVCVVAGGSRALPRTTDRHSFTQSDGRGRPAPRHWLKFLCGHVPVQFMTRSEPTRLVVGAPFTTHSTPK